MIVSDKALPIRFYDNLYDQNRFNSLCHDNCQLELVYPQSRLPQFQFKRDAIFGLPDNLFLRNVCNDLPNYYREIPEGADNFCNSVLSSSFYQANTGSQYFPWEVALETTIPPANYLVDLFDVNCCSFKMLPNNIPNNPTVSYIALSNPILTFPISSNTKKYHFKICVDKLIGTSTIQVKNGVTLLGIISAAGTYDFYFTSGANDINLTFDTISFGDDLQISYMQAYLLDFDGIITGDVALNSSYLSVANLKDGTDIITNCLEDTSQFIVPEGMYYYIVESGGKFYFSEVFKVVSLRKLEEYFKLEWLNTCDINNCILYKPSSLGVDGFGLGCSFKNVLYLEAALFSPTYSTDEESEVNGQGDLNVRFKRWQKSISLDAGKSPEFLTDALTAIFIHDTITITEPLNLYQDIQSRVSKILSITSEVSDILNECFQRVILNLLLEDTLTDAACCNTAEIISCDPCDYNASDLGGCASTGYWLDIQVAIGWSAAPSCTNPQFAYTLRRCDGTVVNPRTTDIICFMGKYYSLYWFKGVSCFNPLQQVQYFAASLIAPTLSSAVFTFLGFNLTGQLLPNTYGQAFFQPNCAGAWIPAGIFSVGNDGNFLYLIPASVVIPYMPMTKICFKVENLTQNCTFGETETLCVGTCP